MDLDNQDAQPQVEETPKTETVEATETPEAQAAEASESQETLSSPTPENPEAGESPEAPPVEVPAEPQYQPNFEYRVGSKVKEFDERLRSIIKDKETEEYVRDLVTSSEGIQAVKAHRDQALDQLNQYMDNYNNVQQAALNRDLRPAAEALGFNFQTPYDVVKAFGFQKEDVLREAQRLLDLTPEQEQLYDQSREQMSEVERLRLENQELQQRQMQAEIQSIPQEMNFVINSAEGKALKDQYEAVAGPGSFEQWLNDRGDAYFQQGQIVRPTQLVQEFQRTFGPWLQAQATQAAPVAPQPANVTHMQPTTQVVQPQPTPPTIPNTGSTSGQTAVKSQPASLEELKKRAGLS